MSVGTRKLTCLEAEHAGNADPNSTLSVSRRNGMSVRRKLCMDLHAWIYRRLECKRTSEAGRSRMEAKFMMKENAWKGLRASGVYQTNGA